MNEAMPVKKSMATQIVHAVRRMGTVTSLDIAGHFAIPVDRASSHLCDLRKRGLLKVVGRTSIADTGRPCNLFQVMP